MPYQDAASIRRKDSIDKSVRTPDKDKAAKTIERMVDERGWPIPATELAEEAGYSAQHLRNTLRDYFVPVDEEQTHVDRTEQETESVEVTIPEDVDKESYLRGFFEGFVSDNDQPA